MSDERALLAAICAHPEEDTPRLAFADWLDEHAGALPGPKRESVRMRAELIRVQCELARLPPDEEDADTATRRAELENRRDVLLHNPARRKAWAKPLRAASGAPELVPSRDCFVRGFPSFARGTAADYLAAGEGLFEICPLHSLVCPELRAADADQFLAQPWLTRVRRLRITNDREDWRNGSGAALTEKVFTAAALANLEDLELVYWEFGAPGVPPAHRALPHLRRLDLSNGFAYGPASFARLGELLPAETRIREFGMARVSEYGPAELTALAALPQFGQLERLTLGSSLWADGNYAVLSLRAEGVRAVAAAPFWHSLRSLRFDDVGFARTEVESLPDAPARLRTLSLTNTPWGAIPALAAHPFLRTVTALDLTGTSLADSRASDLAASPHLGRLLSLNLSRCGVNDKGVKALADSPLAANLVRLTLDECSIRKGGIDALVAPGNFPRLCRLEVHVTTTVRAQLARLRARFGDGVRF